MSTEETGTPAATPAREPVAIGKLMFDHADEIVACLCVAIAVIASWKRLHHGVDFTDEAFYAAITQRFALGDWPYLDEWNLRQTASLLPVPFYWVFLKVRHGTDGAVFFLRSLYFGLQILTGLSIFRFAVRRIPRSFAMVAATLPVVYVPFGIPTCSYNTLGAMLFAAGSFLGLSALLDDPRPRSFLGAGIVHGLACVGYPPLAIPVTIFGIAAGYQRYRTREDRTWWRVPALYVVGLAVIAVLLVLLLLPGLIHHGVSEALHYEHMTTQVRSIDKAKDVLRGVVDFAPGGPNGWLGLLGVVFLLSRSYPRAKGPLLGLLLAYLAWTYSEVQPQYARNVNSLYECIYLGLAAGFVLLVRGRRPDLFALLLAGWLPSVVAGFISGFATANVNCVNGGIGIFSAACLALVAAPAAAEVELLSPLPRAGAVLVLALVPLGMLSVNMETTYRAGDTVTHTAVVRTGPYRGIRSAPREVKQVEEMTRSVRAQLEAAGNPERMLSYYDLPAPYLAALVRPAMPTVWTDRRAQLHLLLPYYQAHRTGKSIVFVVAGAKNVSPQLEALAESGEVLDEKGWFKIYREPMP